MALITHPLLVTILVVTLTWILLRTVIRAFVPTRRDPTFAPASELGLVPQGCNPDPNSDGIDVIFLHGLGSNPDTTWGGQTKLKSTPANDGHPEAPLAKQQNHWISNYFFPDIPNNLRSHVRIFFFNYESYWLRDSAENRIVSFGRDLFEILVTKVTKHGGRKIILVGHSYGGLVIKETIIRSHSYQLHRDINVYERIKGVVFLGTPHRGATSARLGSILARFLNFLYLGANPNLIEATIYDSIDLQDMHQRFEAAAGDLRIVNFYETRKTRRAFGLWKELVVKEQSATLNGAHTVSMSLDTDHTGLNKFRERNGDYNKVRDKLIELIEVIQARRSTWGKEDYETLQKVRLTDPRDDKARIEEQKGGLLRDSYKWVLDHNDFRRWRDSDGHQFLWIRGDPGKGKTMLVCGIIDELNKSKMESWNVAYYFCQATNERLNTATSVLRGLIYLLLSRRPELLKAVGSEINEASGEKFLDINSWPALCKIFSHLMGEIEKHQQTTYLIVDALDECVKGHDRLLRWVSDVSFSRTKVLVSSRNWPSIEGGLSSARYKVPLHLELNADSISHAVDFYIEFKVEELGRSKQLVAEDLERVRQRLKSKSNSTFLWVALVCQKLGFGDTNPWEVLDMLDEFPPGLSELYERMASQFLSSKSADMCLRVLTVQTLAYRPLALAELLRLVELRAGFTEEWLRRVVELCGSFLTVRGDTIYFVHQSAKDYLIEKMTDSAFRQLYHAGHRTIFKNSIQALSETLQENIYQLPSPGSLIKSIKVPDPDPLHGIRYACIHWADHLENALRLENSTLMETQELEDHKLLHRFLESHLLHWFEALSLLKRLGSGIEALTKVLSLLREGGKRESHLGKLVYDAERFSRQHKTAIGATPLQVYSSTLVFSPTGSVVRKLFINKPEWLLIGPTGKREWSSRLQILEDSTDVTAAVFSPNGRHLALVLEFGFVLIYDVVTCEFLNSPESHCRGDVVSVAFSPSGRFIALAATNGPFSILDASTGLHLRTLGEVLSSVNQDFNPSIAFLDDDNIVLIVDGIWLWHITTGECLGKVRIDHKLGPWHLSRNGRRAAWLSKDKRRMEVVDIIHGTSWNKEIAPPVLPVFILPSNKMPLALSPSGELVAVTTECGEHGTRIYINEICHCIQVWNIATSECIRILHLFKSGQPCMAISFSPNDTYLAAAADDKCVVWDITTGQSILFAGWGASLQHEVTLLEFSPDSTLLVSAGIRREPVYVWDMELSRLNTEFSDSFQPQLEEETNVHFMTLSPDGTLLGIQCDNEFQIWDTKNNNCLYTIETTQHSQVEFSPDSEHIVCVRPIEPTAGSIIELFHAPTGRRLWRSNSEFHSRTIFFSADRRYLGLRGISNSRDLQPISSTIQVLDAATGTRLSVFQVASSNISLTPGPRGTEVAILLYRSTQRNFCSPSELQIWDMVTGLSTHSIALPESITSNVKFDVHKPPEDSGVFTFSPDGKYVAYPQVYER